MSIYRKFLRLYLVSFVLANIVFVVFLFKSPYILMVFIIKPIGYFFIYLVNRPMCSRYDCYFGNMGFSSTRLFTTLCVVDFIIFSILIAPLKLLI